MTYPTDLTPRQSLLVLSLIGEEMPKLRKYDIISVLNAISYVIKTGCQWRMLPCEMPPWWTVYHHYRSWSDRGWFARLLGVLVEGKRACEGSELCADMAVVDSQSVRSALAQSQKGVDGHKRIKGIKRHIAVDERGYPLAVHVTEANVHDSKGALPLIANLLATNPEVASIKADKGYGGNLADSLVRNLCIEMQCVKSNFGTPEFIPMDGRWVVERTFAWMDNYRRLCRNYEKYLSVAAHAFTAACVLFMLRYFA